MLWQYPVHCSYENASKWFIWMISFIVKMHDAICIVNVCLFLTERLNTYTIFHRHLLLHILYDKCIAVSCIHEIRIIVQKKHEVIPVRVVHGMHVVIHRTRMSGNYSETPHLYIIQLKSRLKLISIVCLTVSLKLLPANIERFRMMPETNTPHDYAKIQDGGWRYIC